MKADVVVIGSGISGLTAGTLLAGNGKKVVIIEQQHAPGGAIRQFRRKKIPFDVGFHYTGCLGQSEILSLLWGYCGALKDIAVTGLGPDGYDHFEFIESEKTVKGFFSYQRFSEELESVFPSERDGIRNYLNTIRSVCTDVPFYNTSLPLTPFLRGYKTPPRPLASFFDQEVKDPFLRAVLAAPGFLYGVPGHKASLEVHALVAHGYYSGAYTVSGGGQGIVDAFVAAFRRHGGVLLSGCRAEKIEVHNGSVTGVTCDGDCFIDCRDVIFSGHPAQVAEMVPEGVFRPAYRKRLLDLENSLTMYAVFGESKKRLDPGTPPMNYYLLPSAGDILRKREHTRMRPMMMTGTRDTSADRLQSGKNGIILLRLGDWEEMDRFKDSVKNARPADYISFKNKVAAEMIDEAEKRWGNHCGTIEPLAVGSPLTFRDELSAPQGCAYGAMHCLGQYNPEARTRLPGLFLCGQSTLMTGVAGASLSGLIAAGEILGLEWLWEEVRTCH